MSTHWFPTSFDKTICYCSSISNKWNDCYPDRMWIPLGWTIVRILIIPVSRLIFSEMWLAHQCWRHIIEISAQRRQQHSSPHRPCPWCPDVTAFSSVPGGLYHFDKKTRWDLYSGFPSLKSAWQDGKSHHVWFSRMSIWGIHLLPFFWMAGE